MYFEAVVKSYHTARQLSDPMYSAMAPDTDFGLSLGRNKCLGYELSYAQFRPANIAPVNSRPSNAVSKIQTSWLELNDAEETTPSASTATESDVSGWSFCESTIASSLTSPTASNAVSSVATSPSAAEAVSTKTIICDGCEKSFTGHWALTNMRRHQNSSCSAQKAFKIYKCIEPECDKWYNRSDNLTKHINDRHPSSRPNSQWLDTAARIALKS